MNNITRTDKVRLKHRFGAYGPITRRYWKDGQYVKEQYHWHLENGCIQELPKDYWEILENDWLDRTTNLRYKDAFIEL